MVCCGSSTEIGLQPHACKACRLGTSVVWAAPGSLAATTGIMLLPPGTEMFQFPRFPPPYGGAHKSERVAPFGDRGIIACTRLPHAYRRVATSFIGTQRQGIHRLLIMSSLTKDHCSDAEYARPAFWFAWTFWTSSTV